MVSFLAFKSTFCTLNSDFYFFEKGLMSYLITIGLEIHLKLKTQTKIFCQCKNEQNFDTLQPNIHTCPVCTGQPGALPLLSQEVVEKALLLGKALNCHINQISRFDRKSYFYPDLPMGYQITQFYTPLNVDGKVKFFLNDYQQEKEVTITEAHLECDTAKMIHSGSDGLLDFNRAGTPLVEIVMGPDFESADEAVEFAKEIQRIGKWNGISDADMEKGQLRVDVNISLRPSKDDPLGTKVEVKNINSFSAIKRAIEAEYQRQSSLLDAGERVMQETRRWDDSKGASLGMRSKEDALDYRYFPEPDMPALEVSDELLSEMSQKKLEIPYSFIKQCREEFGFHKEYINALFADQEVLEFFLSFVEKGFDPKSVAKWMVGPMKWSIDYVQYRTHGFSLNLVDDPINSGLSVNEFLDRKLLFVEQFSDLSSFFHHISEFFVVFLTLEKEKKLIDNQLKIVFDDLLQTGKSVDQIVKERGFDAPVMEDDELAGIVASVLNENPKIVEEFRGGKEAVIGFFVGQVMRKTGGKVNPQVAQEELKKQLSQI